MRNRALHDALRDFALEAAALLNDDQKAGAEIEFDVDEEARRRGPVLYRYRPLTDRFINQRWHRLRDLPGCSRAAAALGDGAVHYLRVRGLRGEQSEPALRSMLERLYEDATTFVFPEERFERVYEEVERTLYQGTVHATVLAPLPGLVMDARRVERPRPPGATAPRSRSRWFCSRPTWSSTTARPRARRGPASASWSVGCGCSRPAP
jgi:hypothetical protein